LKYVFDEDTGRPTLGRDGELEEREWFGEGTCPPMCQTEKGCPKGTPENPRTLNERNQMAYEHYKQCRAVGRFPEDPVVERNAAVIRELEDEHDRRLQRKSQKDLMDLIQLIVS